LRTPIFIFRPFFSPDDFIVFISPAGEAKSPAGHSRPDNNLRLFCG
jgi:hypothetical protein